VFVGRIAVTTAGALVDTGVWVGAAQALNIMAVEAAIKVKRNILFDMVFLFFI
jgi:hypothetical protein